MCVTLGLQFEWPKEFGMVVCYKRNLVRKIEMSIHQNHFSKAKPVCFIHKFLILSSVIWTMQENKPHAFKKYINISNDNSFKSLNIIYLRLFRRLTLKLPY